MTMRPYLWIVLVASGAFAPGVDRQEPPPANVHRGWVLESIGAGTAVARDVYANAASDATATRELRAVALARLVELDRVRGDAGAEAAHLATLGELMPEGRSLPEADLSALREAAELAFATPPGSERDARLKELRARVATLDTAQAIPLRRAVAPVVRAMQQERSDLERRLERELTDARTSGQRQRVLELRRMLRELAPEASSRQLLRRWVGTWRVRATRMLVQGELDEAERIRRSFEPDAEDQPVPQDPAAALAALRKVAERPNLSAAERQALADLHEELSSDTSPHKPARVRGTLARLPYRLR